jgi:phage shock protein A
VLRADAHGIVDNLEDQSLLLKQAVRDAQNAFDDNQKCLEETQTRLEASRTRLARLIPDLDNLDVDVDRAMAVGDVELQKFVTRKFLRAKAERQSLEHQIEDLAKEETQQRELLTQQEQQLDEIKARVSELLRRKSVPDDLSSADVSARDVEMELLRRRGGGAS